MSLDLSFPTREISLPAVPWQRAVDWRNERYDVMFDEGDIHIHYSESDTKGRYGASVPGFAGDAELTLSKVSHSLVIADRTFVPRELRRRGIGRALVVRLIADARDKGQRIVPLCLFVKLHAQKHREDLSDVIQW